MIAHNTARRRVSGDAHYRVGGHWRRTLQGGDSGDTHYRGRDSGDTHYSMLIIITSCVLEVEVVELEFSDSVDETFL